MSIFALLIGISFILGAVQMTVDWGDPRPERVVTDHALPPAPPLPAAESSIPANPDAPTVPRVATFSPELRPAGTVPGRLVLDISMGDFVIEPGPPGEPIRVIADYDANSFVLEESYTPTGDGGWTYDIDFRAKGGWMGLLMRGGVEEGDNEVRIIVPRDQPFVLEGKIGIGKSETDLGGLWVEAVDIAFGTGDHFLEISEPPPFPYEHFFVDAGIGEVEVRNVGAASPARVMVEHGIGELTVDLRGPWQNDATIMLDLGIGEARVLLPQDVFADIDSSVSLGERTVDRRDPSEIPEGAPTLTVEVGGNIGELSVQ
ncbi:MAG: hypothetical protein AAGD38_18110 [Acidobacteriota bacterium]